MQPKNKILDGLRETLRYYAQVDDVNEAVGLLLLLIQSVESARAYLQFAVTSPSRDVHVARST